MKNVILTVAFVSMASALSAQTFVTTTALPAPVPDGVGTCLPGAPLVCNIPVTGLATPSTVTLNFTFSTPHTWFTDLQIVVTSPSGASANALIPGCTALPDDDSNAAGPYVLSDTAAQLFDVAGIVCGAPACTVIPAGTYGPDSALSGLLACGVNGNWTVTFRDHFLVDTGVLGACSLTFGAGAATESFTICQNGPGAPVNLIHINGPANGIFINPVVFNTPAAVPTGWCFGLDIPWPLFLSEMTNPAFAGLLYGTLDITGTAFIAVPAVPVGLTIQIVGVHFNAMTSLPTFSSPATSYTVI